MFLKNDGIYFGDIILENLTVKDKFKLLLENQVVLLGDKDDTNSKNRLRMEA